MGTPISNSMTEFYTNMRYLRYGTESLAAFTADRERRYQRTEEVHLAKRQKLNRLSRIKCRAGGNGERMNCRKRLK